MLSSHEDICSPGTGSWQFSERFAADASQSLVCMTASDCWKEAVHLEYPFLVIQKQAGTKQGEESGLLLSFDSLNQGRREAGLWSFSECGAWRRRMQTVLQLLLWPVSERIETKDVKCQGRRSLWSPLDWAEGCFPANSNLLSVHPLARLAWTQLVLCNSLTAFTPIFDILILFHLESSRTFSGWVRRLERVSPRDDWVLKTKKVAKHDNPLDPMACPRNWLLHYLGDQPGVRMVMPAFIAN